MPSPKYHKNFFPLAFQKLIYFLGPFPLVAFFIFGTGSAVGSFWHCGSSWSGIVEQISKNIVYFCYKKYNLLRRRRL